MGPQDGVLSREFFITATRARIMGCYSADGGETHGPEAADRSIQGHSAR